MGRGPARAQNMPCDICRNATEVKSVAMEYVMNLQRVVTRAVWTVDPVCKVGLTFRSAAFPNVQCNAMQHNTHTSFGDYMRVSVVCGMT